MMAAGLLDRVQVTIFPVVSGTTGLRPILEGAGDLDLELLESHTFDGRTQKLAYHPTPHRDHHVMITIRSITPHAAVGADEELQGMLGGQVTTRLARVVSSAGEPDAPTSADGLRATTRPELLDRAVARLDPESLDALDTRRPVRRTRSFGPLRPGGGVPR